MNRTRVAIGAALVVALFGASAVVSDSPPAAGDVEYVASVVGLADGSVELVCVVGDCPAPTTTTTTTTTTTVAPTTTTTAPPTTTTAAPTTTTTTVPPTTTTAPPVTGASFACDFATACELDQFVQYRDAFVVSTNAGQSDHAVHPDAAVGTDTAAWCTAPEQTRPWVRNEPYGLTYRCLPGGDPAAAHQMSVAPDTAGYTFTGSSPNVVLEGVSRIQFDVNMTSAGARNFWEVAVIPADHAFVDAMPCIPDLPCNDSYDYDDIGGYGFGNAGSDGSGAVIATPTRPDGYIFNRWSPQAMTNGDVLYPDTTPYPWRAVTLHQGNTDIRTRYTVTIEDRPDGLWFGQEDADGRTHWVTLAGEHLPAGPVRVVVKFHGYTPTKEGNGPGFAGNVSPSVGAFTWHWDNLSVDAASSLPSSTYYGGQLNSDRFVTSSAGESCIAFAEGQRGESNANSGVAPLISCPGGFGAFAGPGVQYGPLG